MNANLEKVKLLARDLRDGKEFPRSPRETLAGYVLAAGQSTSAALSLSDGRASITPIVLSTGCG